MVSLGKEPGGLGAPRFSAVYIQVQVCKTRPPADFSAWALLSELSSAESFSVLFRGVSKREVGLRLAGLLRGQSGGFWFDQYGLLSFLAPSSWPALLRATGTGRKTKPNGLLGPLS